MAPKTTIVITDSKMLQKAVYNPDTEELEVVFKNGSSGIYSPVTLPLFGEFEKADSKGFFVNSRLKVPGIIYQKLPKEQPNEEQKLDAETF